MTDWIAAASFVITGLVLVWRMGGVASRLDTLLTLLTERVNVIDSRLQYVERNPHAPVPPKKRSKTPLTLVRKPR